MPLDPLDSDVVYFAPPSVIFWVEPWYDLLINLKFQAESVVSYITAYILQPPVLMSFKRRY